MKRQPYRLPPSAAALAFATAVVLVAGLGFLPADTPHPRPLIGDFTGELAPGGPVYRLAPLNVVAQRVKEVA
jgi:hypothetical protein